MTARIIEDTSSLGNIGHQEVAKVGRTALEGLRQQNKKKFEKMMKYMHEQGIIDSQKENLDIGDTQLYTTAIASFIEQKLRPQLVAEQVIRSINAPAKGADSIKVPVRSALITANDLPDDGSVSYDGGTFSSQTLTLRYKYAANRLTHEIIQTAGVDLISYEMGEIGSAIARKVDSDIISELQTKTTTANGNRTPLGASTTATFDDIVDARKSARENNAFPDTVLMSPESEATIFKTSTFTSGSNVTGAAAMQGQTGSTSRLCRACWVCVC